MKADVEERDLELDPPTLEQALELDEQFVLKPVVFEYSREQQS